MSYEVLSPSSPNELAAAYVSAVNDAQATASERLSLTMASRLEAVTAELYDRPRVRDVGVVLGRLPMLAARASVSPTTENAGVVGQQPKAQLHQQPPPPRAPTLAGELSSPARAMPLARKARRSATSSMPAAPDTSFAAFAQLPPGSRDAAALPAPNRQPSPIRYRHDIDAQFAAGRLAHVSQEVPQLSEALGRGSSQPLSKPPRARSATRERDALPVASAPAPAPAPAPTRASILKAAPVPSPSSPPRPEAPVDALSAAVSQAADEVDIALAALQASGGGGPPAQSGYESSDIDSDDEEARWRREGSDLLARTLKSAAAAVSAPRSPSNIPAPQMRAMSPQRMRSLKPSALALLRRTLKKSSDGAAAVSALAASMSATAARDSSFSSHSSTDDSFFFAAARAEARREAAAALPPSVAAGEALPGEPPAPAQPPADTPPESPPSVYALVEDDVARRVRRERRARGGAVAAAESLSAAARGGLVTSAASAAAAAAELEFDVQAYRPQPAPPHSYLGRSSSGHQAKLDERVVIDLGLSSPGASSFAVFGKADYQDILRQQRRQQLELEEQRKQPPLHQPTPPIRGAALEALLRGLSPPPPEQSAPPQLRPPAHPPASPMRAPAPVAPVSVPEKTKAAPRADQRPDAALKVSSVIGGTRGSLHDSPPTDFTSSLKNIIGSGSNVDRAASHRAGLLDEPLAALLAQRFQAALAQTGHGGGDSDDDDL
jgi:hypothetical protein